MCKEIQTEPRRCEVCFITPKERDKIDAFVYRCWGCGSYINNQGKVYPLAFGKLVVKYLLRQELNSNLKKYKDLEMGFPTNSTIEKASQEPGKSVKIEETLRERGNRYGDFKDHARITQTLKRVMQSTPKWLQLTDEMREALEMTAHKIGRILNGDPTYKDSWHDIIGYIRLVEQGLED